MATKSKSIKAEPTQINLNFGFMGDDVNTQLHGVGFKLSKEDSDEIESIRRSVMMLHMKGFLTDTTVKGLVTKMSKFVQKNMVSIDG